MNRGNDAIIKAGFAELHCAGEEKPLDDEMLWDLGERITSSADDRWLTPFGELFIEHKGDFSSMGRLFATACISIVNLDTGNSRQFGSLNLPSYEQSHQRDFSGEMEKLWG